MADPVLTAGQYSIGTEGSSSAFVYGGRYPAYSNSIQVANTAIDTGTLLTQDQANVGHDGQLFGVDTQPGIMVTQTGQAYTPGNPAAAMDAYSSLAAAWNDPRVRLTDGTVVALRCFYPGSAFARRIYGRGRKILPTLGLAFNGLMPYTAQFQAADDLWYSDTLSQASLSMQPSFLGGLTFPATPPFQFAPQRNASHAFAQNTGQMATWPVITIHGPFSFPTLTYFGTSAAIAFNGILGAGDQLVIDTRPWARTILMNGGAQWQGLRVAGLLTGSPMIAMQLQPGTTQIILGGQDFTGKSTCTVAWRSAYKLIGGTQQ